MISPELAERLLSEGFDAVNRAMAASPRVQMLRRCAVPRSFDRLLYKEVLSRGPLPFEGVVPGFDEVIEWSEVEIVPRRVGRFRVRDRQRHLAVPGSSRRSERTTLPEDLLKLTRAVVAFLREDDREDPQELLHHLTACDPAAARELFEKLYDGADSAADMARCQELLAAAGERFATLPADFQSLIDDRRTYFRARCLWNDDYTKSRMYLERPQLSKDLTDFVLGKTVQWIANVYGRGGYGKTATIRWLISRWCALAPRRIPVARLDFDFDDPIQVTTNRPLFLLKLARQFDEQMQKTPFLELRHMLESITDEDEPAAAGPQSEGANAQFLARFIDGLLTRTGPTLIVFDTLEVATFNQTELEKIFALLVAMHERVPALRVLLAGRYDLNESFPPFARYAKMSKTIAVTQFTGVEAHRYLATRRGVTDPKIIDAVVRRARGMPMTLTLYADIIRTTPDFDAADLEGYGDDVEMVYLIRRIVMRVTNKRVHWVLRYGAIPRVLTPAFIRDVMVPLLGPAMSGKVDWDEASAGIAADDLEQVFLQNLLESAQDEIDVDVLWEDLQRYASASSWVMKGTDSAHQKTLKFHPDLLNPMRRLLAGQPVFRMLHQRAIEHYDRKSVIDPEHRIDHLRNAIYHRFQIDAPDAERFWHDAVQHAIDAGAFDDARQLAMEITRQDEYVDAVELIRRKDGTSIVRARLVADAFLIDALLALQSARASHGEEWGHASQSASRAQVFLAASDDVGDARLESVLAALALQTGDLVTARRHIEQAAPTNDRETLSLDLVRIDLASSLPDIAEVGEAADRAYRVAKRNGFFTHGDPPIFLLDRDPHSIEPLVAYAYAARLRESGKFDRAFEAYGEWSGIVEARGDVAAATECTVRMARVLMDAGEPDAAVGLLRKLDSQRNVRHVVLAFSEAYRRGLTPLPALEDWLRILDQVGAADAPARYQRARVLADLYEAGEARLQFELAMDGFLKTSVASFAACAEDAARAELYQFGDVDAAQKIIERIQVTATTPRMQARLHALQTELAAVREIGETTSVVPDDWLGLSPEDAIVVIAAGMRAEDAWTRDEWARALSDVLPRVTPATARVALLAPLRHVAGTIAAEIAADLRAHVVDSQRESIAGNPVDAALREIVLADVLRVCGDGDGALRALEHAERVLAAERPLVMMLISAARGRLGTPTTASSKEMLAALRRAYARFPGLLGVACLEEAERAATQSPELAQSLLEEAAEFLPTSESIMRPRMQRLQQKLVFKSAAGASATRGVASAEPVDDGISIELVKSGGAVLVHTSLETAFRGRPSPTEFLGGSGPTDGYISQFFINDVLENPDLVADRMFDYVFDRPVDRHDPRDIRFFCSEITWSAFPWELPFLVERPSPLFYRAKSNRIPDFRPLRIRRAIVVRPVAEQVFADVRGAHALDFENRYEQLDLETFHIPIEALDSLRSVLQSRDGDTLLHLAIGFSESRGNVILGDSRKGATSGILNRILEGSNARPLVILDPPLPTSVPEAWRQLMLRNILAAEFSRGRAVHSVIAAGLLPFGSGEACVDGLREGTTIRALARSLADLGAQYGRMRSVGAAVALFTDDPSTPVGL